MSCPLQRGQAVFPTPVGVFLHCVRLPETRVSLPHARGGVSVKLVINGKHIQSSPRPWGCFSPMTGVALPAPVFPTPVGVFPKNTKSNGVTLGLPHARGGVSIRTTNQSRWQQSSPRPWGCFQLSQEFTSKMPVFPTPVGVFLHTNASTRQRTSLPHARGGVST